MTRTNDSKPTDPIEHGEGTRDSDTPAADSGDAATEAPKTSATEVLDSPPYDSQATLPFDSNATVPLNATPVVANGANDTVPYENAVPLDNTVPLHAAPGSLTPAASTGYA
ncbi:hypothetical protein [Cryobacterium sp. Y11]|uniref:hypothetical protein n=1 Tax=Cryobacterium sp. Y11 TaxID=2045016 RepID=UPI000CE50A7E|nr:hypothetical protein [Cryobacterium sp. Y11]